MSAFEKLGKPVLGGSETGTLFDAYITREDHSSPYGGAAPGDCADERSCPYRMDVSWRPEKALAVSFSRDGEQWSFPKATLRAVPGSGWESDVNRCCVLRDGGGYTMWYTGQTGGRSCIGAAMSDDGLTFRRFRSLPVLSPEFAWEGMSVMNPCVLRENGMYKMWYSSGETYEPNVIGYAESPDGVEWTKRPEPVFAAGTDEYERDRVGGCQVLRTPDYGYLLFYIGYRDIHTACVCLARSDDGVSGWKRCAMNPLVSPTPGAWDADSCYKPTVVRDGDTWRLWYNGRRDGDEYIGEAVFDGRLSF